MEGKRRDRKAKGRRKYITKTREPHNRKMRGSVNRRKVRGEKKSLGKQ